MNFTDKRIEQLEQKLALYDEAWKANGDWVVYMEKRMVKFEDRLSQQEALNQGLVNSIARLEELFNDHCIYTTGEPACHHKPEPSSVSDIPCLCDYGEKCSVCSPKPSVEKCDTITISRKVAEEWLPTTKMHYILQKDSAMVKEVEGALSKEA
jgi:uncharacterized coiled-coil protein SlyX